jgi:hypothetical protein
MACLLHLNEPCRCFTDALERALALEIADMLTIPKAEWFAEQLRKKTPIEVAFEVVEEKRDGDPKC